MKKIIAMILALTTAASLGVVAMADDTSATANNNITFEVGTDNIDINTNPILLPGKTYHFPVKLDGADLTSLQNSSFKFHFANENGKRMIDSMKIEKYKSLYQLTIKTKAGWPTEMTDVAYSITVVDSKGQVKNINAPDLDFQVGYQTIEDSALSNTEYVVVTEDRPVITEDQFDALNDYADGKEVTLAGGDWEYTVRVNGMTDRNMVFNSNDIDEIVDKFSENDFKFVSFPAGPEFRSTGDLVIDVSDEIDDYEGKFFVYRYTGGKLVKQDVTVDMDDETITLKTKQLGRFVITNKEIKDNTIVTSGNSGSSSSSSSSSGNNGSSNEQNPDTGANDFVGLAVAMAAVATTGIVVASKKKK